jgi:hypothetical protein
MNLQNNLNSRIEYNNFTNSINISSNTKGLIIVFWFNIMNPFLVAISQRKPLAPLQTDVNDINDINKLLHYAS